MTITMSQSTAGLFTSLLEKTLTVEIQDSGVTPISAPHSTGWRSLRGLVTACVDGAVRIESEDHPPFVTRPGWVFCMPAGRRHCFTLTAGSAVSRWSHVQFHVFSSLDLMALIDPPTRFTGAVAERIGALNAELAQCQEADGSPLPDLHSISRRLAAAYGLLETIIGACGEPARGLHTLREAERLAPALALMDERLADADLTLADLARATGLSPSRFHAVFKQVLGLAPARHLQRRRMARAEALLLGSTLRIRDLAERCGWSDEFHFSRLFKRLHGLSPLAYREQLSDQARLG